ncbi:MAG: enoyl-CoA hydratase-related protein [Chloroflexi bacterium]|nr:enoyl-CoA hydratase-related protein [Chloroflexota bacterium]
MTFNTIIYEKEASLAYVRLNRPDMLNAYSIEMRDDLYEAFTAVRDDPDVRVMVICGIGKAFCAGADLTQFGTAPSPTIARNVRWARDVWGILKDMDKPTIAAVHGYVLGSGLELALLCGLRIAADGCRFGLPETTLGFIPAAGGTQSLARIVKPGSAMAMILTGQRIDATQAYRLGLVHRVVPKENLMREAQELASRILAAGPLATCLAKRAVNTGLDLTLEQGIALEASLSNMAYGTSDAWEGLRAYVERRVPSFRGL